MDKFFVLFLIFLSTLFGAFGSIYLKKGSRNLSRDLFKNIFLILKNYELLFGLGIFFFSSFFYVWALKQAPLSIVYPITSFTYVWVSLFSIKFLGEKMNKYKWLGILFIILGVFLITKTV